MSAHCSLSPDDVFVCCVGSMCVVLGPAVSADWLPSCAPAACVSVAVHGALSHLYMYQSGVRQSWPCLLSSPVSAV